MEGVLDDDAGGSAFSELSSVQRIPILDAVLMTGTTVLVDDDY